MKPRNARTTLALATAAAVVGALLDAWRSADQGAHALTHPAPLVAFTLLALLIAADATCVLWARKVRA